MCIDIKNIELKTYLQGLLGNDLLPFLQSAPEPPAIRINRLKTRPESFLAFLDRIGQPFRTIPFNHDGLILDQDTYPLSHSLAFFTGQFAYQGISSQLPVLMLNAAPGDTVLDMAAAPGSKSAQLASHMQQTGILVLNDASLVRMQPLNANMQRTGAVNHYTLRLRGERTGTLFPEYFDKVLVDAPCTALGNLSENHEVHYWWSLAKLDKLIHIQDQLLISALKSLKVGGEMVYATCSVAPEENELVIQRLLERYPVSVQPPPQAIAGRFDPGYTRYREQCLHPDLHHAVRIFPNRHQMEGFFAIRLRKEDALKKTAGKEAAWSATETCTHPDIEPVLAQIGDTWGIDYDQWQGYRYLLTKTRIWMTGPQIEAVPRGHLVSGGLLLAEKRRSGWKLVNGSVQYFSKKITKRCLELERPKLIRLFCDLCLPYQGEKEHYYILTSGGEPIASVYSDGTQLKLRSSHRYRLVL